MNTVRIRTDEQGNKVVVLPEIVFWNKQDIEWDKVRSYLERYVGEVIEIIDTNDLVYVGSKFTDEYSGSKYTRKMRGARAKAKANAAQGIRKIVAIANEKKFRENHKDKHMRDAKQGWYYYLTRFALPVYDNNKKTDIYNVYSACVVINKAANGKMYLYDIVDIKKEASNSFKTNE